MVDAGVLCSGTWSRPRGWTPACRMSGPWPSADQAPVDPRGPTDRRQVRGISSLGDRPGLPGGASSDRWPAPTADHVWTGRKFFTRPGELESVVGGDLDLAEPDDAHGGAGADPQRVGAGWPRGSAAAAPGCVMVPTTQSADLRAYLLQAHQERPPRFQAAGPAAVAAPRRVARAHRRRAGRPAAPVVKHPLLDRQAPHRGLLQRLDALTRTARTGLVRRARHRTTARPPWRSWPATPTRPRLLRLGQARLTRFLIRHSRGAWRDDHARALLTAAQESFALWGT